MDVALTPRGHPVVEQTVDRVLGREAELVASLDDDERERLSTSLAALLADVHARVRSDQ